MRDAYTKKLENCVKQMMRPLRGLPFTLVIETLSGHKVLPFKADSKDKKCLEILKKAARMAGTEVNKVGIVRTRANEVGNDIEPFVENAIRTLGCESGKPKTKGGKGKTTAYPDLYFVDGAGRMNYVECKTFNIKNLSTTQRSFYFSPSDDFKVASDAHHFLLSFEIYVVGRKSRNNIYKCQSWKIVTLDDLDVDVKYEFNSSNKRLYVSGAILAEGITLELCAELSDTWK